MSLSSDAAAVCDTSGVSHTFFSGATDKARAGELINVLKEAGQVVPKELLAFGTTVKKKESALYGETALAGLQICQKESLLTALHLLTHHLSICLHSADVASSYMHQITYC